MHIHHHGGLAGQLFLLVEAEGLADKVAEAPVGAALDGELVAVVLVDLFDVAGGGAKHPEGARATSISFGPEKPTTQSPQKGG